MTDRVGKKVAVSVMWDTVRLEIICSSNYEAQVLYDDLIDRLRRGEGIGLNLAQDSAPAEPES